jgi:HD-GYP domain-containing protein (c-di-GMP phosphodiesterase class II)
VVNIESMGREIVEKGRDTLIARDRAYLQEKVHDIATLLAGRARLAEQVLRNQARTVETALAQPDIANNSVFYRATDFDAGKVATTQLPRYRRGGSETVLPVSLEHGVLFVPRGENPDRLETAMQRLSSVTSEYRSLYKTPGLSSMWHYTSLESGLHNSFPGHGGYPTEYDPRQRAWYRQAVAAGRLIWTRALIDATTGRLIVTGAMPVYQPNGQLAGVTALDIAIDDLFKSSAASPKPWLEHGQMMILTRDEDQLKVFAKQSYHPQRLAWDEPLGTEYFAPSTSDLYEEIAQLSEPGQVLLYQADDQEHLALWAVTPIGAHQGYLAVMFPLAELSASATRAAEFVNRQSGAQLIALGQVVAGIVLIIVIVALLVAQKVTRQLSTMAQTASAIADGKLDSRIDVQSSDEIGSLASSLNTMASSIERLQQEQETAHLQMIRTLTRVLEKKDSYTAAHSGRVANYSVKLGKRIGLDEETLNLLKHGALTHDLGKIGVPDQILNKPAPLDNEEAAVMSQHPEYTAKIMRPLVRFNAFAQIAAWHHERWDGNGYPDGLKGEDIPVLARIVAIADTWDAMTGDRVYRKGMHAGKALDILEREVDSGQWDPRLLREFIAMIREELTGSLGGQGKRVEQGA